MDSQEEVQYPENGALTVIPEAGSCLLKESCVLNQPSVLASIGIGMTSSDLLKLRWLIIGILLSVIVLIAVPLFFTIYPFKTVVFTVPIEVMNPRVAETGPEGVVEMVPHVPANGVVHMKINYIKYINNPGLVVRTLVRKVNNQIEVLDSSTVITTRKCGSGETNATFALNPNDFLVGENTYVVFTIYYTLFGFRQTMDQFWTEKFTITEVGNLHHRSNRPPPQYW
jgi:hypothetical protein